MKKLGPKADPRKGGGSKEGAKIAWGESNHRTKGKKKKATQNKTTTGWGREEGGSIFKK